MDINISLIYLFPTADPNENWKIKKDGNGDQVIDYWDLPDSQPTQQELIDIYPTALADYDTKKAAKKVKDDSVIANAKQKLGFTDEQYADWVATINSGIVI